MRRHLLMAALVLGAVSLHAERQPPDRPHTIDETERLARAHLALELRSDPRDITVAERGERRWADADFECGPRKGLREPLSVEGYRFVLVHDGKRYEYRADRRGHVKQCPERKPVGTRG